MNKQYIAPQVEVATLGIQSIICASAPAPAPGKTIGVLDQQTNQQW